MKNLLFPLVAAVAQQKKAQFVRKTRQTARVQERFLRSLLRSHQETEFGRQFNLAQIQTVDQFRDQIPILPYSYYEPLMERIANGERNILTAEPVIFLGMTSGSTGRQKLVPVTPRSRKIRGRLNQISSGFLTAALQRRQRQLGKMLLTSSVQLLGRTSGGIDYGPISVGELRLNNRIYRQFFAHPFEALKPNDSLARHYICLLFALRERNTRAIGANFPILGLRLANYLETYGEDLIEDLDKGTIADWLKLEPGLRRALEANWNADPARAAALRHILNRDGRLTPKAVWDLSVLVTARGGTSDFYFERFPDYFGEVPVFGGIYASSEAVFGTYHELDDDAVILAIDSGFYEFIPEDQWHLEQPPTLLATEVSPGQRYRILVTNYSGLYRYDIGDVVEVLGFYNDAPLIVFRHRRGGLLSSTSEKTTEFHVIQVMQRLQQTFDLALENFCITLSETEVPPHYLVNIELAPGHHLTDPQQFITLFDRYLKDINTSYEVKRPDQVPPPRLRILAPGSFATVRQRLLNRGIPESQLKFPHISDDRRWLAGLTVEQEITIESGVIPDSSATLAKSA